MRKILIIVTLVVFVFSLQAQTIRDEIRDNIRCSASNYMAYPNPVQHTLTPAPYRKKPFYISHYGRHGSRYHNKKETYEIPYEMLATADSLGKLTPFGKDVMHRLDMIRQDAHGLWGELTALGARQHRDIMRRMVERFPEVFQDSASVDARSTVLARCVLSMENAMLQLAKMRPHITIHDNVTQRDMYYLNGQAHLPFDDMIDSVSKARYDAFAKKYEKNDRLMGELFNDMDYVHQHVDEAMLNYYLFKVASNVQSTEVRRTITLYDLFTDEEAYRNWKKENAWWYLSFGGSTNKNGSQPYGQSQLLRRIIEQADSCIRLSHPSAHLRYGHDTVLLPLVCLLDVNGYGMTTDNLESLDRKHWANYKIFPMASNIQLVFYRENPADEDVLVKVLLNENEASLPLKRVGDAYYHWSDFKDYYLKKLAEHEKQSE